MNNTFKKKGAVEMSLNLIIMLIIGMVVLGLVIGFVNSLVGQGVKGFEDQLGDNDKLKLEEIKNCREVFCIIPETSIKLAKGEDTKVFIKIRNVGLTNEIVIGPGPTAIGATTKLILASVDEAGTGDTDLGFSLTGPGFDGGALAVGKEDSQMYTLRVLDTTSLGVHFVTFGISIDSAEYTQVVTITVE
jgi:hypothetical protein